MLLVSLYNHDYGFVMVVWRKPLKLFDLVEFTKNFCVVFYQSYLSRRNNWINNHQRLWSCPHKMHYIFVGNLRDGETVFNSINGVEILDWINHEMSADIL